MLLSPNLIIGDVTLKQPVTLLGQAQGYEDGKAKNHLFKPNPFIFLKHKWDQRITELSNHEKGSNLREISPEYSLEGLMLKVKLQYFGHLCEELTHWKRLGKIEGRRRRG